MDRGSVDCKTRTFNVQRRAAPKPSERHHPPHYSARIRWGGRASRRGVPRPAARPDAGRRCDPKPAARPSMRQTTTRLPSSPRPLILHHPTLSPRAAHRFTSRHCGRNGPHTEHVVLTTSPGQCAHRCDNDVPRQRIRDEAPQAHKVPGSLVTSGELQREAGDDRDEDEEAHDDHRVHPACTSLVRARAALHAVPGAEL